MKKRTFSTILAATFTLSLMPAFNVSAAQSVSLYIEKVEVQTASLGEDRTVDVTMKIDGNEAGFLASEFGVAYDNRLTLQSVTAEQAPGSLFTYADNPDVDIVWFAGASGSKSASACSGRQDLLTMTFALPADYTVGDVFNIGFSWDGLDGQAAYWYSDKKENDIDWLRGHSITGSITVPDPNAPKLSVTSIQMNQGETTAVAIDNFTGTPIWYSDHADIADVDADGNITAYAPGVATIYCFANTSLLTCEVKVTEEYFYSILGDSPIVLTDPGHKVFVEYPNAQGMIVWMSTRNDIVKVVDGQLTGVKNGTAQIIATCNGVTYARQVVVNFPEEETTVPQTQMSSESLPATDLDPIDDSRSNAPTTIKCGDVNLDSAVDILDVIVLNKSLMLGQPLSEIATKAADVRQDGSINETDSLTLLKHIIKVLPSIPV